MYLQSNKRQRRFLRPEQWGSPHYVLQMRMNFHRQSSQYHPMKSALPVFCALCLWTVSLPQGAIAAAQTAPQTVAGSSVDTKAAALRKQFPYLSRGPKYNEIPMEYRLVNIAGPKAKRILDDYVDFGFSDFGTLILTKKASLPIALRTEPCTTCGLEKNRGRQLTEYFVFWVRGLSDKQKTELIAALQKI